MTQFTPAKIDQLMAVQLDRTRSRLDQTVDAAQQRTFARTGCADNRNNTAALDLQIQVFEHRVVLPVTFYEVGNL